MMVIVCVHTVKLIMSSKGPNAKELSDEDLRRASPAFTTVLKIMSSGGVCARQGGGGMQDHFLDA